MFLSVFPLWFENVLHIASITLAYVLLEVNGICALYHMAAVGIGIWTA